MTTDTRRSFFSTTTGVLTGVAGFVTAIVGLITASVQLGWVGSDSSKDSGGGGGGGAPGVTVTSTATTVVAQFTADPSRVTFTALGSKESLVTVRNTSSTAPITLRAPSIAGPDRSAFSATDVSCGSRLDAGRSCEVRVRFVPPRTGDYVGTLVLQPEAGPAKEVDLSGKAIL